MKRFHSANTDHFRFQTVFRPEPEGGFTVLVPALPGCITYGKTLEHAQRMAEDAITAYVEDMIADGEPVPKPDASLLGSIDVKIARKSRSLLHA